MKGVKKIGVSLETGLLPEQSQHWAIVDLKGTARHTRTIPMPAWVKYVLDQWLQAPNITVRRVFRRVHKIGKAWGVQLTEKAVWHVVRECAAEAGLTG